ncbi:MAG: hypothetical protein DDT36_00929 [Firmicutes bacterium]|nr:hypothetical protein [Bacillota bacterium]
MIAEFNVNNFHLALHSGVEAMIEQTEHRFRRRQDGLSPACLERHIEAAHPHSGYLLPRHNENDVSGKDAMSPKGLHVFDSVAGIVERGHAVEDKIPRVT